MTAAVIGCGESARGWWKQVSEDGAGSFGVNDAAKHGMGFHNLIIVNGPHKFGYDAAKHGMGFHNLIIVNGPHKFGPERMKFITDHDSHRIFTNTPIMWREAGLKKAKYIQIHQFYGKRLQKDRIVFSKTSPFVAMSMAYNQGYDDIRLFGVDFNDHKNFKAGERAGDFEIAQYAKYAELAAKECVKIRVTKESALSKFIDTF